MGKFIQFMLRIIREMPTRKYLFLLTFLMALLLTFLLLFKFSIKEEVLITPKEATLCGEEVPLYDPRIWEKLDREMTFLYWDRGQVMMWLKRLPRYFPYIEKRLKEEGLPEDLKYIAIAESSLVDNIRSYMGAAGIWQFVPQTARNEGLQVTWLYDERMHLILSTEAAINYFKFLHRAFDDWSLAVASYNCGIGRLNGMIKTQKTRDYYYMELPVETERYIYRILAIKEIIENSRRHRELLGNDHSYPELRSEQYKVTLQNSKSIEDLASEAGVTTLIFQQYNPHVLGRYLPKGTYRLFKPKI